MSSVVTWPAATTRPVVLLGDPVAHSLSPQLHNTVFRSVGLDLVYLAMRVQADALAGAVAALGAMGAVGANITVPHKLDAVRLVDHLSEEATLVGAVNTLTWRGGQLYGTNTDATGLARVLDATVAKLGDGLGVVFGTGGVARAAAVALARRGADVAVIGRRVEGVEAIVEVARRAGATFARGVVLGEPGVTATVREARVVVNATTLGMAGEQLPAELMDLTPGQVAHDLVYGHGVTPFVAAARSRGVVAHDGMGMLVAQAFDAFRAWTGQDAPAGAYEAAAYPDGRNG